MANKQSRSALKSRKRKHLDAEDRRLILEKKALKKQKKLEFGAKLAESHQVKKAIAAAQTVAIDDVIRAIQSNRPSNGSKRSSTSTRFSVDTLLSGLGVEKKVDNLAWSSDEGSQNESESGSGSSDEYSSDEESSTPVGTRADLSQDEDEVDDGLDDEPEDESDDESSDSPVVGFHKRVSFPSDTDFTTESQTLLSSFMGEKKNIVLCSEKFHDPAVARSCYLGLTAQLVSHLLTKVHRVEKNNQKLKKSNPNLSELGIDSPFRDQGPNRARVCVLAPFRANCYEIVRNILTLLDLTPENVANGENFFQEYEGQDTRNTHAKNWEDWRRELFKGHYDDNNYDDFVVGITFGFGKVKLFFPKSADKLLHMDMIIASPLALSRIAAEDFKTVKKHEKQKKERLDVEDDDEAPINDDTEDHAEDTVVPMDFLSGLEILVVDRIDALSMQNWNNLVDVVTAANRKPIATISADIDRIEEKFLEESSAHHRQTVLICGSTYSEKFSQLMTHGDCEPVFVGTSEDSWSGRSLSRALKHGIKQQFFINVSDIMDYFRSKYWTDIGGNEIRGLIIIVSHEQDYDGLRDFLENNEGITDCYLHETEVASHRRKLKEILKNFKTGVSRIIVVSERLLWYQRVRILTGAHVLFFGAPVNDSVYADILSDIEDPGRCTSVCLHGPDEIQARRRIVGSKNQTAENIPGKVVVFTNN